MKKKIKVAIVGAGNRGGIYASYALSHPSDMEVCAVVDPNRLHREELGKAHGVKKENLFSSVAEFIAAKAECDVAINATIDGLHYEISKELLNGGFNVLMEKPITAKKEELLDLERLAKKNGKLLAVCHVLRYSPFYRTIKEELEKGTIGKITSIEMAEHVEVGHYLESYVVGKWKSEKECGSSFLLAKSCHDLDVMCWLNNLTEPMKAASFAERKIFVPENAPEGHGERCYDCACEKDCKYSLKRFFALPYSKRIRIVNDINKPLSEITDEDINEQVKNSDYGKCAYEMKDQADRQHVTIEFANGSIGSFQLVGAAPFGNRYIHIVGENGELYGNMSDGKYLLRTYDFETFKKSERIVDAKGDNSDGHGGGDTGIMRDLIAYLRGEGASVSMTKIEDSVNGHLCVYAAEASRKENRIVDFSEEFLRG